MSMISSLIDELRKSADEWNGSNMFELARMCRDAADTIWQLRDDLQRANAENAKLRELVKQMHDHIKESCDICDEDYCSSWDEDNECCVYDTLAREVGIEVGE